jgi:hypothetical protein
VDGLSIAGAIAARRGMAARRRPRLKAGPVLRWLAALVWFVVTVLPIWWMFNVVFTAGGVPVALNPRLYPSSIPAGIENVGYILTQTPMLHSILVSFTYAFFQILGMLIVVPMAAYEFALFKFPGKNALFLIALSALMVPGAVTLIPLYKIVAALGWVNTLQGLAVRAVRVQAVHGERAARAARRGRDRRRVALPDLQPGRAAALDERGRDAERHHLHVLVGQLHLAAGHLEQAGLVHRVDHGFAVLRAVEPRHDRGRHVGGVPGRAAADPVLRVPAAVHHPGHRADRYEGVTRA